MKVRVAIDARAPASDRENRPAIFRLESGAFLLHPRTETWLEEKLERAGLEMERCDPGKSLLTPQSLDAMIVCMAA